ncbi:MAG: Ig-like domain-containing protein [Treponema sp.]|nr:Ig-like domain-containing protein [Treponema sp.]
MKFKKTLTLFVLFSIFASVAFAHGKKDIEEKDVENLNSWQEKFDLSEKKKGKYNIMITATDLGGNTYVEGPHNIMVDPDSDLCIPGITNPIPNMRVVGNLNIVGTCIDDDGVKKVELILDGEKTVTAVGGEFWSYYLDTADLEEGPHTVEVVGYDINDLEGKHTKLTWQLDRRQPVTSVKEKDMVTDRAMGQLVSGNVRFAGLVEDGNGIKSLAYSLDNGENFQSVKIKTNDKKKNAEFDVTVNTRDFNDGPAVIWFKAVDNSGSTGIYSFLYFIDNTKPDVRIISPAKDQEVNGKFSVAGFAKDAIGITSLKWTFGSESGEVELIPGNPYWSLDFDTTDQKIKSQKFTITAVDAAENVVTVSQNILINQELDKPVVTLSQPASGSQYDEHDELYVRGIAVDDDAVEGVYISLDGGEEVYHETRGVFFHSFGTVEELGTGKHKVTVTAIDVNGVRGNPVTMDFMTLGRVPQYSEPVINAGKEVVPFVNGIEVHPEAGSSFAVDIASTAGIKAVHTEYSIGKNEPVGTDVTLKNVGSYKAVIPVTRNMPKGIVNVKVSATDIYDRVSEYYGLIYVTNTTEIKQATPSVIFDDSRVAIEDGQGLIVNNSEFPASGYLIGDIATYVELVPETPFATAALKGNQIQLIPGNAKGSSEPVVVRVTTVKGDTFDSIPLVFSNDTAVPALSIDGYSASDPINLVESIDEEERTFTRKDIAITGKATCETGMNKVKYRVMSATVAMDPAKYIIRTVNGASVPEEFTDAVSNEDGTFAINVSTEDFEPGVYLVEITAVSSAGNTTTKAVCFKMIPDVMPDLKGKYAAPKVPSIVWFNGYDVYAAGVYQGELTETFKSFPREDMIEGNNALSWSTAPAETEKPVSSKYTASKNPTLSANFALVNDSPYMSGMKVPLQYGNDKTVVPATITAYIDTGAAVTAATYEIYGEEIAGGDVKQTGSAKLTKPLAGEVRWTAEIPLKNLPARVTKVKLNIKAGGMTQSIEGTVEIVRPKEETEMDDAENIYTLASADVKFNSASNQYIMTTDSRFYYYANFPAPISVELVGAPDGLSITTEGNLVTLQAEKDNYYNDVVIKVTDILGDVHESKPCSFAVDGTAPEVVIVTPALHDWESNTVVLSGTAADSLGIKAVDYSLDNGETWTQFVLESGDPKNLGVTFTKDVNISSFEDGLIQIDVRAFDMSGNSTVQRTSVYKDTTPPEVTVVLPAAEDIVNGETLIVFDVKDNGLYNRTEYVLPPAMAGADSTNVLIPARPLIATLIGTKECPIDDAMSFEFIDDAGNKTHLGSWNFLINNESDLPVSEIHVPEENQVLTRDFTISGVIYDDDGSAEIYYKIDDGEYKKYPEIGTSFSIDVPISTMVDNEHTVTVYAVDVNGVKGQEVVRNFRISLAEPKAVLVSPDMDTSVRGVVSLSGWALDENGIDRVLVSLDNGNSYNDAELTYQEDNNADWVYTVDSRAIPGGSQVVFLKTFDKYGIQGLYSSLIYVDNNAPVLTLELPVDESTTTGQLFFSGYSYDNVEITDMHVTIRNLDRSAAPYVQKFEVERVIGKVVDLTGMDDGFYNIELTAIDAAGNATSVSRNIHLDKNQPDAVVDILYPLNGEHKTGEFNIYGQASSEKEIVLLNLYIDDKYIGETVLTDSGFYRFPITREILSDGVHYYRIDAVLNNGVTISSPVQKITYSAYGPWITIDNFVYGTFAMNRPIIRGRAGYSIDEAEVAYAKSKECPVAIKEAFAGKAIEKVELSMDNGRSFIPLSDNDKWMYRIENMDWTEGYHFLLLRVTMKNGEVAIERTIVQIDNTRPTVHLISPEIGKAYNQELEFSGLSSDDVGLENVTVTLRKGDKSSYEVPSFIQGLYLDANVWGATLYSVGAGLTFFDDNVKLQVQFGQFTQSQRDWVSNVLGMPLTDSRYGGNVIGMKLLANISTIPFAYFFGHDWDWLSASFAIGANFSRFSETNSGTAQILSALLGQIEFPRIQLSNRKMFSAFSGYTECSVWFIPTDVQSDDGGSGPAKIVPQFSIGVRCNVF